MANAADIIVNLVAKTGRFDRGMAGGAKKLEKFRASTQKMIKSAATLAKRFAALAVAATLVALVKITKQAIDANDALGKMATTIGVMPGRLRGLQVAAELAGVEQNAFNKGLIKVSKAVVDAANGLTTYQRVFDRLNLTTEELLKLSPDKQLLLIGQRISGLKSTTERVAAAYDLFGGRNVQMVNLLANSRQEIEKTIDRVRDLGAGLSNFEVAQFEAAKDSLTLMSVASEGLKNNLAIALLPLVTIMSEKMQLIATDSQSTQNAWADTAREMVRSVGAIVGISRGIITTLRLVKALGTRATLVVLKPIAAVQRRAAQLKALLPGVTFDPAAQSLTKVVDALEASLKGTDDLIISYDGVLGEMDKFVAKWDAAVDRAGAAAASIAEQRKLLAEANAELLKFIEARRLKEEAILEAERRAAKIAALITGQMTAREVLADKIRQITDAILANEGDISKLMEARRRLVEKLVEEGKADALTLSELGVQAVRNIQDTLAEFFASTSGGFKQMLRDFVNMIRRMVAQLLARKILLSFLGFLAKGSGGLASFAQSVLKDLPKKHLGGSVGAGQAVITGGPGSEELFVPQSAGRIFAGGKLGGVSISIQQTNVFENSGALSADTIVPLLIGNNQLLKAEIFGELRDGALG